MRPLLIKMQGFGPFRDETTVDFTDVELVGLVGSTGSGKSTILDAITFALFGRIARLDAKAVAPVINVLSQEARVSFDFELDGEQYTAIRVVRRTKTGASTKEARLEFGAESLAATSDEVSGQVEKLLGMNFDRFTKVVFLPQGKFSAFLHDKPADRQRLLRVLLGLGIYEELGKRARAIKAKASDQLEVLRPKLAEAGVTDAQIAALDAAAESLRSQHALLHDRLAERSTQVDELARLTKSAEDFGILTLAVDSVSVPAEVRELGAQLAATDNAVAEAETALTAANNRYASAAEALANGPDKSRFGRWLEAHVEIAALTARITELEAAQTEAQSARDQAQIAADEFGAQVARAADATSQAEQSEATATHELSEYRPAAAIEKDLLAHQHVDELEHKIRTLGQTAEAAAQAHNQATSVLADAVAELTAAQASLREIETAGHVAVLAGSLVAGEECPVCQQVIIDLPRHAASGEIDAAAQGVSAAEAAVSAARASETTCSQAAAVSRANLADAEAERDAHVERVATLRSIAELEVQQAQRATLEDAAATARAQAEQARAHERELRNSDLATDTSQALTTATTASARALAELAAAQSRQHDVNVSLSDAPNRTDCAEQLAIADELAGAQTAAQHERDAATHAVTAARANRSEIQQHQERLRRDFSAMRDRFVGIDPPQPRHASVLDDWQAFADWAAAQRAPLEAHHLAAAEQTDAAAQTLTAADAETRSACAAIPELADAPIDQLDARMTRLVASAEAQADSARRRLQQLADDKAEVERLEETEEVHDLLGNQLRSSGFEQWLLDEVVEGLVVRASERLFELSRGQYSIEVDGMVFEVRDHRNGDELRDARTLSGGETFLASLALALALADSIEEMAPEDTPAIECLFLDEGFGTLDPETLDVVASAIEELGASGRMVGVITHIRDLAERMPVRFEVTKHATTSVVEKVFS